MNASGGNRSVVSNAASLIRPMVCIKNKCCYVKFCFEQSKLADFGWVIPLTCPYAAIHVLEDEPCMLFDRPRKTGKTLMLCERLKEYTSLWNGIKILVVCGEQSKEEFCNKLLSDPVAHRNSEYSISRVNAYLRSMIVDLDDYSFKKLNGYVPNIIMTDDVMPDEFEGDGLLARFLMETHSFFDIGFYTFTKYMPHLFLSNPITIPLRRSK